jgi:hypothetical protein
VTTTENIAQETLEEQVPEGELKDWGEPHHRAKEDKCINPILVAALEKADNGVRVFPVRPDKSKLTPAGYNIATTDSAQIREWFTETDNLLAIRPSDAGCVVLDVPAERVNAPELKDLPPTYSVRTPSGGRHLRFKTKKKFGHASFAPGIKVISDKGYVVAPPSPGYVEEIGPADPAPLPDWAADQLSAEWTPFTSYSPEEYESMPKIEFWDEDKTLPKVPDGAIEIVAAQRGHHKTNLVLTWAFDAITKGARVVYASGEGSYGVGTQRVPAHAAKRKIPLADLRDKLLLIKGVPLLTNDASVDEFITHVEAKMPKVDIIVIDTLATATAGIEENSSKISSLLTDNGAAGRIKNAFNALVIILAHEGKERGRGVRGHSGLEGNVDALLTVTAWKSGGIDVLVEKMKDGKDGFHVYYKVPPKGSEEIPVPHQTSHEHFLFLTKEDRARAAKDDKAKAGSADDEAGEGKETPKPTARAGKKTQQQRADELGISLSTLKRRISDRSISQNPVISTA